MRFEPDGHGGWTVMLDGQPQSHVDLADPGLITFEYVQHFALAIGALIVYPDTPWIKMVDLSRFIAG